MLLISWHAALLGLACAGALYLYGSRVETEQHWGDARQGMRFQVARNALLSMADGSVVAPVNWRPELLVCEAGGRHGIAGTQAFVRGNQREAGGLLARAQRAGRPHLRACAALHLEPRRPVNATGCPRARHLATERAVRRPRRAVAALAAPDAPRPNGPNAPTRWTRCAVPFAPQPSGRVRRDGVRRGQAGAAAAA